MNDYEYLAYPDEARVLRYMITLGDIESGMQFYGPFMSREEADEFITRQRIKGYYPKVFEMRGPL